MDRTVRAALLAAFIAFATVAGLGIFLGFEVGASLLAGAIAGVLAAGLLWGAARRADGFASDDPPPPVRPGFPGPPEPTDDEPRRGDRRRDAEHPGDDRPDGPGPDPRSR